MADKSNYKDQELKYNKHMQQEQYIYINEYGDKRYYKNQKMTIPHRLDGPAVESADGHKFWYVDGYRHRLDGPAIEYANGHKAWYVDGELHRLDGPAIEAADGDKLWFLNDKPLTEEEFNKRKKQSACCNGKIVKIVEIDGKKYKLIEQ